MPLYHFNNQQNQNEINHSSFANIQQIFYLYKFFLKYYSQNQVFSKLRHIYRYNNKINQKL